MAVIRHISIQNFRSIRQAEWFPGSGLNCLIGLEIQENRPLLMLLT
jgi:predicted ATP-dependent endonuclease of OLD family